MGGSRGPGAGVADEADAEAAHDAEVGSPHDSVIGSPRDSKGDASDRLEDGLAGTAGTARPSHTTTLARPTLLRLPVSHYCHKVEWAMRDLRIDVDACNIWFGHLVDIRDINPENTVPVLELEDRLVRGSHDILQWAARQADAELWPRQEVRDWEAWADETIGPLARRDAYRTLYERPWRYTRNPAVWAAGLAGRKLILNILRSIKARRFYGDDDRDREAILARIGDRLRADDGPFLFGEAKTAADYATAALLRPLLRVRLASHTGHPDRGLLTRYVRSVRPRGSPFIAKRRFADADRSRMAAKA